MRNQYTLLALLLLPAAGLSARAATDNGIPDGNYCIAGEAILNSTEGCQDNRKFVDLADDCLNKLVAEVKKVSNSMPKAFSKNDVDKQSAKFNSSLQDYTVASNNLARLILLTAKVHKEIDNYIDNINLPEDTENEEINEGDPDGFARMHPCYGETRESIEDILTDLDDIKDTLTKTKKIADDALAASKERESREGSLNSINPQDFNANSKANSKANQAREEAKKPKSGKSVGGDSKVTGIKESQEKSNLKNFQQ